MGACSTTCLPSIAPRQFGIILLQILLHTVTILLEYQASVINKGFKFQKIFISFQGQFPDEEHSTHSSDDLSNEIDEALDGNTLDNSNYPSTENITPPESIITSKNRHAESTAPKRKIFVSSHKAAAKSKKKEDPRLLQAYNILESVSNASLFRDECTVFGEQITLKLRKFSEQKRSILMHKINSTIYEAEMELYSERRRSTSTSYSSYSFTPIQSPISYHHNPYPQSHSPSPYSSVPASFLPSSPTSEAPHVSQYQPLSVPSASTPVPFASTPVPSAGASEYTQLQAFVNNFSA